jgi:DNA repair exonuclease SbcCD nuclease subunit
MKITVISDLHLGNPRMRITKHIREIEFWFNTHRDDIIDTDMLIISGDLFDRLLTIGEETKHIFSFFRRLDTFCNDNDIIIVELEGTISHDFKQGRSIQHLFSKSEFLYVDDISVHTFNINGTTMNALFVPDSLELTSEEYTQKAKEVLVDNNITKVDLSIMHGMMKHHIDLPTVEVLEQEFFSNISDIVIIGHNHRYQKWNNIYTPGSLSRDRHGEEDDKGGLIVDLDKGSVKRLINKHTSVYVTYKVDDFKDMKSLLKSVFKDQPTNSNIAIVGDKGSKDYESEIKLQASAYNIVFKGKKTKVIDDKIITDVPIIDNINNGNIKKLLLDVVDIGEYTIEEIDMVLDS